MDAINFVNFLRNPGYLHQVTFQELNNLIEQYPYCQNLHYLALRKAQNEKHKDFDKKLELAATYSPNRKWLYKQLQEIQDPEAISDLIPSHSMSDNDPNADSLADLKVESNANLVTSDDMIAPDDNNKQVLDMEPLLEDLPTFDESQPTAKPDEEISFSPEQEEPEFDSPAEISEDSPELEIAKRTFSDIPFEIYAPGQDYAEEEIEEVLPEPEWDLVKEINPGDVSEQANHADSFLENEPIASFDEEEEELVEEEEEIHFDEETPEEEDQKEDQISKVAPLPKTAFSSWKLVNPLTLLPVKNKREPVKKTEKETVIEVTDLFKEKKDKKKKKKKKKKEGTKRYAMKSLMEQEGAISETLAELLAEQGSKKKAIKMYKQLRELYPDKSKAFSKRIKQLRK